MFSRPFSRRISVSFTEEKVPIKQIFLAFCVMLMKPPGPVIRPANLDTFTLPWRSIWAAPR